MSAAREISEAMRRDLVALPDELERQHDTISTFYAFRYRNYRLQWIGDLFTSAAQWIQQTVVGWLVYDLTGSGQILGSVNLMRSVPILLVSPMAGAASSMPNCRRQVNSWLVFRSCRRATSAIEAPSARLSSTIRRFSSIAHDRRLRLSAGGPSSLCDIGDSVRL